MVRHGPGDVVAVCDETGNVTTLQRPQYVQFELSGARLARAIALALGVELNICPLAGCRFAWWLGQLSDSRGASRRVALVADSDNAAATRSLHAATASATAPLLIIPLTSSVVTPESALLLAAKGALCLPAASELLEWVSPGQLRTRVSPFADELASSSDVSGCVVDVGAGLLIDEGRRTATFNGVPITFSSRQRLLFNILRFLARRRPHLIRKSTLMGTGGPWKGKRLADETINSAIGRLRDVLRKDAAVVARAIHTDAVDGEIAVRFEWPPKSE